MKRQLSLGSFLVRIQSKCGKIQTRKTPKAGTIHVVVGREKFFQRVYIKSIDQKMLSVIDWANNPENKNASGLFKNYDTLKLLFFDPPHHHASSRMITRPLFRYVTPIIYFSFLKLKKKTKIRTHP